MENTLYRVLRRYTSLPSLLDILHLKRITLLNPALWDDRNDAFFMVQYKERKQLGSLLALCFTQSPEQYHHWRVFTHGTEGVCVEFCREGLLEAVRDVTGVTASAITYGLIDGLKAKGLQVKDLPFVKRGPYRDENEFRIVYEVSEVGLEVKHLAIPLTVVKRITLSPWLPVGLVETLSSPCLKADPVERCSGVDWRHGDGNTPQAAAPAGPVLHI